MFNLVSLVISYVTNLLLGKEPIARKNIEKFSDLSGLDMAIVMQFGVPGIILFYIIQIILILTFAKELWNLCVVPLFPVKKCTSIWQIIGVVLLLSLLFDEIKKVY